MQYWVWHSSIFSFFEHISFLPFAISLNDILLSTIFFAKWIFNFNAFFLHDQQLADELTQQYEIPQDQAAKITTIYLKQFRKCPENAASTLDTWRCNLWTKALGENYSHLTKTVYERWLQLRYHYLKLSEDTISMLHQMRKKYYLGLISNGPSSSQWEKIRKLYLEQYFDIILVSGDLPWEKPEARIFQEACQSLQVRPDSCIMVGDKLETDILGKYFMNWFFFLIAIEFYKCIFHYLNKWSQLITTY